MVILYDLCLYKQQTNEDRKRNYLTWQKEKFEESEF